MAKTEETLNLEKDIKIATLKMGVFGCLEVTIGFGGKERVDYMTYDTSGIFRCYEIKVSKSDFHSKHKHSFAGHYNYFVLTQELYNQVQDEIPDWVGCYVGQSCVKRPKKQDIDNKTFSMRRSVDGRSTEITMPWTEMLKDSFIRSLYRDSQKLHRSKNSGYVDMMNRKLDQALREANNSQKLKDTLYWNVRNILGRNALKFLTSEHLPEDTELTIQEQVYRMDKHKLALYLHSFQAQEYSISAIEEMLGKTTKEVNEEHES